MTLRKFRALVVFLRRYHISFFFFWKKNDVFLFLYGGVFVLLAMADGGMGEGD